MNREPTAIISGLGALLTSLVKIAVLLNIVQWDATQLAGVSLVIDNALLVFGLIFLRSQVTPVAAPQLDIGTSVNAGTATVTADPVVPDVALDKNAPK